MKTADRVKDSTTVTDTATVTLAGTPPTGFRGFAAALPVGQTGIPVCVYDGGGNWEISSYTLTNSTTLTRESVLSSSNNNAAVAFPAGAKTVACVLTSSLLDKVVTNDDVAFSTTIPLNTGGSRYMPQQTVASVLAFAASSSLVKNSSVYARLVADGTNAPTFSGMKEWGGSLGYDNRAGIVNQITFMYDGYDVWYSISQAVGAVAIDTTAPTASSAAVANSTASTVNVTMSEALDAAYVPAASAFTVAGHTVLSVAISGNAINLSVNPAFVNGEAARTVSYTQPGTNNARDVAGNLLANFSGLAITNNVLPAASAITLTGPTTGPTSSASSNFTVGVSPVGGTISGTVVVTPSDGGAGGTFSPTTVSLTSASPSATFTYTPNATAGAKSITLTNNGGLANPAAWTYTTSSAAPTVSSVTVSPSTVSVAGGGSQTFTATVAGTNSPAQTVTWSASAGSITSGGVFTAPAATSSAQTITITATSTVDTSKSGTATVTVAATATSQDVRLTQLSAGVNEIGSAPPYTYTKVGVSGSYSTNGGISDLQLPANTDGWCSVVAADTAENFFGITTGTAPVAFTAMLFAIYANPSSGNYTTYTNGSSSSVTTILAIQPNDVRRLRRVGTTIYAEIARAADPTNFTVIQTQTGATTAALHFDMNVIKDCAFGPFKGMGLTA